MKMRRPIIRESATVMTEDLRDEIRCHDSDIIAIVRAMGGSTSKYKREPKKAIKAIVAEVHSPPRIAAAIKFLTS